MANKALKGLTIKIGGDTSELTKSLDKVEKQGRDLSSELGQINKLLKFDPKNTELLAQKQKVLADAISNTEDKLDTLREAEKQVQAQFERGEVSEAQYRALQREIIATEGKLDKYKAAAKEAADASEALAKGADDAAEELADQADATEDAERAADDLDDSANGLAMGGLAAVATAAAGAVTAIVALAEESREYRNEMAKLDTAFVDNGHSSAAATKTYEELQSVLGETEQAVEAANHIAALAKNEEDLSKWTDIATGVYAKFGASLPIEGLTEAVNETIRVGQVTGPLADALNWAAKEGETFGVKLKENIEFTKLEKKELEQLTEKQKAEYEAREEQHKAIEEWNKSVEEAASAEDLFNLALEQCTTEQERQQLITEYLTDTYSDAATQFKKTNEEVIRSNQATEKWNKATAKIGKTVEPVVTDIKELGVALLEDASEPLEDIADFIRKDVLPAIRNVSSWVKNNGPLIKTTLTGIAAAMVTFKVATIAASVAQNGLKGAIMATTVAQKALALAQAATPWGLFATAIVGVATAVGALAIATEDAKEPVDILTEEEKELMAAADEAAEAFRQQRDATDKALADVTAEMSNVQSLADELMTLADASGKVKETDKARADFIIHELNEALGTEYSMTGNLINNYKDLKESIDDVIASKTASLLLDAESEAYTKALQEKDSAYQNMTLAEKDYQGQLEVTTEKEKARQTAYENYRLAMESGDQYAIESALIALGAAEDALDAEKAILDEKQAKWDETAGKYEGYVRTINTYTEAQTAFLAEDYDKVVDLLSKKGDAHATYADDVDKETAKVLATLEQEAIDAGIYAEQAKENFEKGVDGYTKEMVDEAEKGYADALRKFASAYSDAHGIGESFGRGLANGIIAMNGEVGAAAIAQIRTGVTAAKKEAEQNSPSKKTMRIGEGLGEGTEVGIENTTKDVKRAAAHQMSEVLDTYRSQEVKAQKTFRNVADQQAARQMTAQMTAASANSTMLEEILTAIKKGQVLTIDGDTLVGATANAMDNALGRRRALAARGAL